MLGRFGFSSKAKRRLPRELKWSVERFSAMSLVGHTPPSGQRACMSAIHPEADEPRIGRGALAGFGPDIAEVALAVASMPLADLELRKVGSRYVLPPAKASALRLVSWSTNESRRP